MPRRQQASVLVIVLVTVVFATTALLLFVERAADDLLVPTRTADANHLRTTAYSALESTLAVLAQFGSGTLHNPSEGWDRPLEWAGFTPPDGQTVTVDFEDESGKISLPTATTQNLSDLFTYWGLSDSDSAKLQDALGVWMRTGYTPTTADAATSTDYAQDVIPFQPPTRSLRSWSELASIEGANTLLCNPDGTLNDLGKRFVADFSLYSFASPNVNAGLPDTLAVIGQITTDQNVTQEVQNVVDYLGGNSTKTLGATGPQIFTNVSAVAGIAGVRLNTTRLTTVITALRVNITVSGGASYFKLSAVITPTTGGATVTAPGRAPTSTTTTTVGATITQAPAAVPVLNYPWTVLELSETDLKPAAPVVKTDDDGNPAPTPDSNPPATNSQDPQT